MLGRIHDKKSVERIFKKSNRVILDFKNKLLIYKHGHIGNKMWGRIDYYTRQFRFSKLGLDDEAYYQYLIKLIKTS